MRFIITSIALLCTLLCQGQTKTQFKVDGVYKGESRSIYTTESYWGIAEITIKKGEIVNLAFSIIDKNNGELFDEKYERHYAGNEAYVQQCRNDFKGVNAYIAKFNKVKKLEKVDAISGATWAHNLFTESVKLALEKAKKAKQ